MICSESWLERYVGDEQQEVWAEILDFASTSGENVRSNIHVQAIVREAMQRARRNVEVIIERLRNSGYEFVDPSSNGYVPRTPLVSPTDSSPRFAQWLSERVGPVPMTVTEWIVVVGDVNLVGNHPEWPERDMLTDALVVEFELRGYADRGPGWDAREYCQSELQAWKDDVAEYGADNVGRFALPFAPDLYHKANVSGGAPYGVYLPDSSVDATCRINGRDISFIEYLRECFRFGGFPGAPSLPQIPSLCRGLQPI